MRAWMLKLAEAQSSDTHNEVFVYRQVLTTAWQDGFEAGMRAAREDESARRMIETVIRKEGDPR
jgi:hypothetical protein